MRPVIFVHGIWDSSRKMKLIAKDLEKLGREVCLIDLHPSDGRLGIEGLANQLKKFVDDNNLQKFDIVAFSMGGIVSKYYITELGGSEKVEKFVTISTPHHGTIWGSVYPLALGKDLKIGGEMTVSLEKRMKNMQQIKSLSIYTPFDLIIIPYTSSKISWGENFKVRELIHPWMVSSRKVREKVENFLIDK